MRDFFSVLSLESAFERKYQTSLTTLRQISANFFFFFLKLQSCVQVSRCLSFVGLCVAQCAPLFVQGKVLRKKYTDPLLGLLWT